MAGPVLFWKGGGGVKIPMTGDLYPGWKPQPAPPKIRGHAARPGTGPEGETCKSCKHYTLRHFAGTYRKCGLTRAKWTGGAGTDIRAGDPACEKWEKPDE